MPTHDLSWRNGNPNVKESPIAIILCSKRRALLHIIRLLIKLVAIEIIVIVPFYRRNLVN